MFKKKKKHISRENDLLYFLKNLVFGEMVKCGQIVLSENKGSNVKLQIFKLQIIYLSSFSTKHKTEMK